METKISAIILTKNEGEDLTECIKHIKPHVDEVVVIDSSDDTSAETISNKLECEHLKVKIGTRNINGFDDLRNFGQSASTNEWCLHIDVDEIFPDSFFSQADSIIRNKNSLYWAYAFPRINLPFYELYPDYQVRLVNKMKSEWISEIHEKVDIFASPSEVRYLSEYPIIHKPKSQYKKEQINKRWASLNKSKNVLICSLFKDSEKYLKNFLEHLNKLISYSTIKYSHKIDLCFIEGDSTDKTYSILKDWLNEIHDINYKFDRINLASDIDRFEKLAILRNLLIKFGLKSYHDYVLMIDSDTLFKENLLTELINSLELNHCDVIAPLPLIENFRDYKDNYFYDTLAFIDNNDNNFRHFYPYCDEITVKDIIKMNSVGTCYLIKADIYNINDFSNYNILKCYDESSNKPLMTYEGYETSNTPVSEQVVLFKKLKRRGFQVYLDNKIEILSYLIFLIV